MILFLIKILIVEIDSAMEESWNAEEREFRLFRSRLTIH